MSQPHTSKLWPVQKRILKVGLLLVILGILGIVGTYLVLFHPMAWSDVPVTSEIGWWSESETKITVTEFSAETPTTRLGLFSHLYLVCFHIKGTIHSNDSRFGGGKIDKVQLTGRAEPRTYAPFDGSQFSPPAVAGIDNDGHGDASEPVADVLLTLVASSDDDPKVMGKDASFDIKVEHVFETMDWGPNHLVCQCGDKTVTVTVFQSK